MPFLLGVVVLVLLLWAGKSFSKADPKQAAKLLRTLGGGAACCSRRFCCFAAKLAPPLRSAPSVSARSAGFRYGRRASAPARRKARVRFRGCVPHLSRWSSITIAARCAAAFWPARRKAPRSTRSTRTTLIGLLGAMDSDSRDLLAAYLDRRHPGWREHAQDDAAAGGGARAASGSKMTEEEAYQILGVQPGAERARPSPAPTGR